MLKITISGVRGRVDEGLTPETVLDFARAFGTYLKGGKVVVGCDTRASGEYLKGIVFSGLLSCGCNVIDLGIATTPTVGIMTKHLKAKGGIVITASHNPNPWNGLKFISSDGLFLVPLEFEKMVKIYENKKFSERDKGTFANFNHANRIHIDKVAKAIKRPRRRFTVVVDSCNGAGSVITPLLLKNLGCKVIAINTNMKLPFPHGPEPPPHNLKELSAAVIKNKADIGFAQDPDADRLSIVTSGGRAISEEYTVALCALYVRPKKIVINLSTSSLVDEVAAKINARVFRTKIGEIHVASEMKKIKAEIGGEGNGGVIYPKVGMNRDSLAGIGIILALLSESGKSIDQIVGELTEYFLAKDKLECQTVADAEKILEKTKEIFRNEKTDSTDGIKVYLKEGWIHLRASNTEPILRIFCEAKNEAQAQELLLGIKSKLL